MIYYVSNQSNNFLANKCLDLYNIQNSFYNQNNYRQDNIFENNEGCNNMINNNPFSNDYQSQQLNDYFNPFPNNCSKYFFLDLFLQRLEIELNLYIKQPLLSGDDPNFANHIHENNINAEKGDELINSFIQFDKRRNTDTISQVSYLEHKSNSDCHSGNSIKSSEKSNLD